MYFYVCIATLTFMITTLNHTLKYASSLAGFQFSCRKTHKSLGSGPRGRSSFFMARPVKYGLKYFPLEIALYDDDKILLAEELIDPDGSRPWPRFAVSAIAVRMFREIYKDGYYMEWTQSIAVARSNGK